MKKQISVLYVASELLISALILLSAFKCYVERLSVSIITACPNVSPPLFRWSDTLRFVSFSVNTLQTALVISQLCTDKTIATLPLKLNIAPLLSIFT